MAKGADRIQRGLGLGTNAKFGHVVPEVAPHELRVVSYPDTLWRQLV